MLRASCTNPCSVLPVLNVSSPTPAAPDFSMGPMLYSYFFVPFRPKSQRGHSKGFRTVVRGTHVERLHVSENYPTFETSSVFRDKGVTDPARRLHRFFLRDESCCLFPACSLPLQPFFRTFLSHLPLTPSSHIFLPLTPLSRNFLPVTPSSCHTFFLHISSHAFFLSHLPLTPSSRTFPLTPFLSHLPLTGRSRSVCVRSTRPGEKLFPW